MVIICMRLSACVDGIEGQAWPFGCVSHWVLLWLWDLSWSNLCYCYWSGVSTCLVAQCGFLKVAQGGGYHCELFFFILEQIFCSVGMLLMTFDLLMFCHSQGKSCCAIYNKVTMVLSSRLLHCPNVKYVIITKSLLHHQWRWWKTPSRLHYVTIVTYQLNH